MTRPSAVLSSPVLIPPKPPVRLAQQPSEFSLQDLLEEEPTTITPQVETETPHWVTAVRCLFDATVRGFVRFAEKFIDDKFLRVSYRLATETARKMSESSFVNVLQGQKVTKKDLSTAFTRSLEHIPATSLIEPNLFEGSVPRMLAGLGNMALRFASRFGFYKVNAIDHKELGTKNLFDDLLSRSVLRSVYVDSPNNFIGIGARILEQLLININLHLVKPISRLFPASGELIDKFISKRAG